MKRFWVIVVALAVVALVGCGGSFDNPTQTNDPTGTIVVNHTLFRGIPSPITHFTFSGRDESGNSTLAPRTLAKSSQVELHSVSVGTKVLRIDYHQNADGVRSRDTAVTGTSEVPVTVVAGQTTFVNNPPLALTPGFTTLTTTIIPETPNPEGYTKLGYGPGEDFQVREDLATAQVGREERREPLVAFAHLSDTHIVDMESPARLEYIRREDSDFQGAFRPHESMTTHVLDSMVQQITAIGDGPATGAPLSFAISTGDNGDNRHLTELKRFIGVLDGATVFPSTGDPDLYEGVQDDTLPYDLNYWHPNSPPTGQSPDKFKTTHGFPTYEGLLDAAIQPIDAAGLQVPWYSVYGNHDTALQGNLVANISRWNTVALGERKVLEIPPGFFDVFTFLGDLYVGFDSPFEGFNDTATLARTVTSDPERQIVDEVQWVQEHFNSPAFPGPVGHGFTSQNAQDGTLYYTFDISPQILGIVLDTVAHSGGDNGVMHSVQFDWLESVLQANSSSYFPPATNIATNTANPDRLIMIFSHHNSQTMDGICEGGGPEGDCVSTSDFLDLFHRYPNVIAWVNGHSHVVRIYEHSDPLGRSNGYWEINTPSHIDYPQQSRIIELADNKDGTLSLFAVMVDHGGPPTPPLAPADALGLAGLSRELSANDPLIDNTTQIGITNDRNVELLLPVPFTLP